MKIISFEALDKAGKALQSNLLAEALRKRGYRVMLDGYPNYSSESGKLIREYLAGRVDLPPIAFEALQNFNKREKLLQYEDWELTGVDVLILDRWLTSQLVYSMANGFSLNLNLNVLHGMPRPDIEFFIDIPVEESMRRKGKWAEGNDIYEGDKELLEEVRTIYLSMGHIIAKKGFYIDGMKTIEEIHKQILSETLYMLTH